MEGIKPEEAIKDITQYMALIKGTVSDVLIRGAMQEAISALKKQVPKAVEYTSDGYDPEGFEVWDAHCPNCEHGLDADCDAIYCPNCGQAIKWEDED